MSETCPWRIHWGVGQESTTQCAKPVHMTLHTITQLSDGRIAVDCDGDPEHEGPSGVQFGQKIQWQAGDRREYVGDWPGLCPHQPCILHLGHNGRHAP